MKLSERLIKIMKDSRDPMVTFLADHMCDDFAKKIDSTERVLMAYSERFKVKFIIDENGVNVEKQND